MTEPEYCADCRDLGQTVLVIHRVGKRGVCATHYRSRLGQRPPAPKETSMTPPETSLAGRRQAS